MTTLITADNGTVSGSAGLKQSADSSGILALATGSGTTAVTIDASQNVGIGTSSPSYKFQVATPSSGIGAAFRYTGGTNNPGLFFTTTEATAVSDINASGSSGSNVLSFSVGNAEKARIDSSGNLQVSNLAGSGSRTVTAGATGILSASSDSSLKQEVIDAPIAGLAEILQIEPKAYKWLDDIELRGDEAAIELGFFADLVAPIIPSAAPMGMNGKYGFYDRAMIAALVKSVHEINAKFEAYVAAHP